MASNYFKAACQDSISPVRSRLVLTRKNVWFGFGLVFAENTVLT